MSKATLVFEGFAAEPKTRVSNNGKNMCDISVAHSPRRKNKQTGEWEDVTDQNGQKVTLWVRATFFGDMADAVYQKVQKGDLVRLEGEPRMNVYATKDGATNASLELQFAEIHLGIRPQRPDSGFNGGSQAPGMSEWGAPSSGGTAPSGFGGGFDDEQPF